MIIFIYFYYILIFFDNLKYFFGIFAYHINGMKVDVYLLYCGSVTNFCNLYLFFHSPGTSVTEIV